MSDDIEGLGRPPITLPAGQGRADSSLRRLELRGQPFYLLKQRGAYADIIYDHGRLLAQEIEDGAFPEIIDTIARGINQGSGLLRRISAAVYRCYSDRVLANVSAEFQQAIEGLADGYIDGLANPRFTRLNVRDALIAIEVGNLVEGLGRILQIRGVRALQLASLLPPILHYLDDEDAKAYLQRAEQEPEVQRAVADALTGMTGPNSRIDFACTGFSVPAAMTHDGRHIHARNLDADLYNWNKAPVLFLIDETAGQAGWHKYAAFGTAGLIYPGGISGLNDAGIGVALHQMSTTEYDSDFLFGRGDIAPFVQQRILREAATLDEAADLVRDSKHFAAWTIFCSDARSGRCRRIEVTGERVRVGPVESGPVAQSNHFFHPDLVERHFDEDDAHFTPSFAKWLDTRARFDSTQDALNREKGKARIDVQWAIERQSSSLDWPLDQLRRAQDKAMPIFSGERAFVRVPRKVYGQLGSIVVGDPQRRAGRDEVWMTSGDVLPTPHSSFIGWQVDWPGFALAPVAQEPLRRTRQYLDSDRTNWQDSLPLYVQARLAVARPRDGQGALLQRQPTAEEDRRNHAKAEALLTGAINLAAKDRIVEVPYHKMRARMRHAVGEDLKAKADWDLLRDIWARQNGQPRIPAEWPVEQPRNGPLMLPYEAAYVLALSCATEDRISGGIGWPGRAECLAEARDILRTVKRELFGDKPAHFDLERWLERIDALATTSGTEVELPTPDFVSAE